MFFNKRKVETKEINRAYQEFLKDDRIILLCVDEIINYDVMHMEGAQDFPIRLIDKDHDELPQDAIYYVYAYNKALSEKACRKLMKYGYTCFDLGSIMLFKGPTSSYKKGKKRK